MKFDFNASIIGPDNRGTSEDSCGGVWHINRHYERKIEDNWNTRPFDPFVAGYSGPLGFSNVLFTISSQTSLNVWQQHTIDISEYLSATIRVVFWYRQLGNYTGDLQIDDIAIDGTTYTFESGNEGFISNLAAISAGTPCLSYPGGFGTGSLSTSTSGNGLWLRDNGGTGSGATGSTIDHTLGTTAGYYVHAETSGPTLDRPFFLATPSIILSGNPGNMTFWTSRYGATIGTLEVYVFVEQLP